MSAERLSIQEAKEVKLPLLNPVARVKRIREHAGELAVGREDVFGETKANTRRKLVILAQRGEALDHQKEVLTQHTRKLEGLVEATDGLNTTLITFTETWRDLDQPNSINQPEPFKPEGE